MDRDAFLRFLSRRVRVCDGPLGLILEQGVTAGMPLPELLALEDPRRLVEFHRKAAEAGADILLTHTLAANGPTLEPLGLRDRLAAIIERAVSAAREGRDAVEGAPGGERAWVGAVLGPLAPGVRPRGSLELDPAVAAQSEVVRLARDAGAELFVLDGMSDLQDLKAALMAVRDEAPERPVIAQMVFGAGGQSRSATPPAAAWALARSLGADVVGAAGNLTPGEMMRIASAYRAVSDLPFLVRPGGSASPREFARQMVPLVEKGAALIGCGGCSTPRHVAYLRRSTRDCRARIPDRAPRLILSSRERDVEVGSRRGLVTARAWTGPAADLVRSGAQMVEVRAASRGEEEPAMLRKMVQMAQGRTRCPLLITATTRRGMEEALKAAVGRPLIASIWGDRGRLGRVLPLIRRYGAGVVIACLAGDRRLEDAEARIAVAEEIVQQCLGAGLQQQDLVIDPAAVPFIGEERQLAEVLRTLALAKERLGQPTLLRLNRMSEGLSAGRSTLEAALLAMAAPAGLDLAVGYFDDPNLLRQAGAANYLTGRDPGGRRFAASVGKTRPSTGPQGRPVWKKRRV